MLGLFKKTNWKLEGKAFDFFRQVFVQLPSEYGFLLAHLDRGLYRRFSVNHSMKGNYYSIGFDPAQSDRSMNKGKDIELKNIVILQDGRSYPLNISIYDGLWSGFEIAENPSDLKDYKIDISLLDQDESKSLISPKVAGLVTGLTCDELNLTRLEEFTVEDKSFFQIKDLDDGNYIAIDDQGQVFGLFHDPYKIELINRSVRQFVDDVNHGRVDFDRYLEGQKGYA